MIINSRFYLLTIIPTTNENHPIYDFNLIMRNGIITIHIKGSYSIKWEISLIWVIYIIIIIWSATTWNTDICCLIDGDINVSCVSVRKINISCSIEISPTIVIPKLTEFWSSIPSPRRIAWRYWWSSITIVGQTRITVSNFAEYWAKSFTLWLMKQKSKNKEEDKTPIMNIVCTHWVVNYFII
jgi:hypothetical protein